MFQHGPDPSDLMDKGGITSTSRMPQQGGQENAKVGCSRADRSVGDLSKLEFRAHFSYFGHHPDSAIERQSFIATSLSLIPNEHFVLKELPFYEIARLADSEAHQAHLEEREKKLQEITLRQAPIASR
ncbi:hypothetical protein CK203_045597 [Vitis vinifera]|uniref:Uncharacterized protein n=1 Tax=Vitis vinifera TaxID=29760 RepID=A0A438HLG3_VITVI|nr:hypothetical protein CK203_045597 [Vitis vinifera]